jgi:hypothetical protein
MGQLKNFPVNDLYEQKWHTVLYKCTEKHVFLDIIYLLFLFKKRIVLETGFCLRLQVKPTHLDPIDRASPCLQTMEGGLKIKNKSPEIGTSSLDWTQLATFHMERRQNTISETLYVLDKNGRMGNAQKHEII